MKDVFLENVNRLEDEKDADTLIDMIHTWTYTEQEKTYVRLAINRILTNFPQVKDSLKKRD